MKVSHYLDPRQCDAFLCGPSPGPKDGSQYSPWRCDMIKAFDLMDTAKSIGLGIPEFGHGQTHQVGKRMFPDFDAADWETKQIDGCMVQIFWLDFAIGNKEDPESKPGFDTRFELGIALGQRRWRHKKILIGIPDKQSELPRRLGLIEHHLKLSGIKIHKSIYDMAAEAVEIIYNGRY